MAIILKDNILKLFAQEFNLFFLHGIRHKDCKDNFCMHMCLKHNWTSPEYDEYYIIFLETL